MLLWHSSKSIKVNKKNTPMRKNLLVWFKALPSCHVQCRVLGVSWPNCWMPQWILGCNIQLIAALPTCGDWHYISEATVASHRTCAAANRGIGFLNAAKFPEARGDASPQASLCHVLALQTVPDPLMVNKTWTYDWPIITSLEHRDTISNQ